MFSMIALLDLSLVCAADSAFAGNYLLYLEAQGVAGYSSQANQPIYYSMDPMDVMQKPGVGFDYLQRFSGEEGDWGALAIQGRAVYSGAFDEDSHDELQLQLYNAYFKYKAGVADLWLGHNRIPFGLGSYLDSHALLLQPLAMRGYGYDRDWGVGASHDFQWGDASLALSTGSGMRLDFDGNYLVSGRVSRGVLSQDNYNIGISTSIGQPLDTMGYEKVMPDPVKTLLVGSDVTYLWNRLENRLEAAVGEKDDQETYALLWRVGLNFLEEDRLKLEAQPVYKKVYGEGSYEISGAVTYKLTSDITLRGMYTYDDGFDDNRIVFQLYWYHRVL
jgi:hypothetical protein